MLELTVRLVVSLAIIVGILLLLTKVGSRRFQGRTGALVRVVHRQPLSRTSALAVVTVGGRVLVIGTTEHQVSLLAELDPDELALAEIVDATEQAELAELAELQHLVPDEVIAAGPRPALPAVTLPAVTHRAAGRHASHRASGTQSSVATGRLAGSVLSVDTWRQALAAATGRTP